MSTYKVGGPSEGRTAGKLPHRRNRRQPSHTHSATPEEMGPANYHSALDDRRPHQIRSGIGDHPRRIGGRGSARQEPGAGRGRKWTEAAYYAQRRAARPVTRRS